jgi:hypothetical protein
MKKAYLKPEVRSEVLEPGVLAQAGSPAGPPDGGPARDCFLNTPGTCCQSS